MGVWGSCDPKDQDWNPYSYCGLNPVIKVDPNGEFWNVIGAIAGAAAMGYIGGVSSSGSANPAEWKGKDWFSAGMGGISGGMMGYGIGKHLDFQKSRWGLGVKADGGLLSTSDAIIDYHVKAEEAAKVNATNKALSYENLVSEVGGGDGKTLFDFKLYSKAELSSRYAPNMPSGSWIEKRPLNINIIGIAGGDDATLFSIRREGYYRVRYSTFKEVDVRFQLKLPLKASIYHQNTGRLCPDKTYQYLGAEWKPWYSGE